MPRAAPLAVPAVPDVSADAAPGLGSHALPDPSAVLDARGVIVAVDRAWRMFTVDNGGRPDVTGVGVDYLPVCARAATAGCEDAAEVETALRAVLQGSSVEQVREYPCPSPAVGRWFLLRVTPIGGASAGALVSHTNITRQKMAELDLERRASQDPLTGLANREQFSERVEAALAAREQAGGAHGEVGLLYLDLDGFKPVNDTFGHTAPLGGWPASWSGWRRRSRRRTPFTGRWCTSASASARASSGRERASRTRCTARTRRCMR